MPKLKTAILLVGGRSSRMGTDKFAMEINDQPQWKFMAEELSKFFDDVRISCRRDQAEHFEGYPLIFDELGDIGPMGAIHASFHKNHSHETIFFIACDLPCFDESIMEELHAQLTNDYDVVAAKNPDRNQAEPLVAFWNISALPTIEKYIEEKNYALYKCMSQLKVKTVEVSDSSTLRNVNSPKDL